jgi:hypothetical protein
VRNKFVNTLWMMIAAVALLALAVYAQASIPRFTATARNVFITRAILIVTGLAFGYVAATTFPPEEVPPALAFLVAFGAVHFPAALILFFKRGSGAGKS